MSLENDITKIKIEIQEQSDNMFKSAGSQELSNREAGHKAEVQKRIDANPVKVAPWIGHNPGVCPRCGSDDLTWHETNDDLGQTLYGFECNDCDAIGDEVYSKVYSHTVVEKDPWE